MKPRLITLCTGVGVFTVTALVLAEVALRLAPISVDVQVGENRRFYRMHHELGWFPVAGSKGWFQASVRIRVEHNSRGFRDHELGEKTKPRVAVVGDSYVWGYDVEKGDRLSEKLQEELPGFEVLNLGVSGYGTDQEYLLLKAEFDRIDPDVVLLVFCENDIDDNASNVRYEGYYKPYFEADAAGGLRLHGVPVPGGLRLVESQYPWLIHGRALTLAPRLWYRWALPSISLQKNPTLAILTALRDFVESRGAAFTVGFVPDRAGRVAGVMNEAARHAITVVDLGGSEVFPHYGQHWTPKGHLIAANRFKPFVHARPLHHETMHAGMRRSAPVAASPSSP